MTLSSLAAAAILLAVNPAVLANCYDVYAAFLCTLLYFVFAAVIYAVALLILLAAIPRGIWTLSNISLDYKLPLRLLCAVTIYVLALCDRWRRCLSRKGWVPLLSTVWTGRAMITSQGMYTVRPFI